MDHLVGRVTKRHMTPCGLGIGKSQSGRLRWMLALGACPKLGRKRRYAG